MLLHSQPLAYVADRIIIWNDGFFFITVQHKNKFLESFELEVNKLPSGYIATKYIIKEKKATHSEKTVNSHMKDTPPQINVHTEFADSSMTGFGKNL